MSCKLTLYEHGNYTGDHTHRTTTFTNTDTYGWGSQMPRIQDRDSSGKVEGPCAWAIMEHGHNNGGGFIIDPNEHVPNFHAENHHGQGKGSTNHRFYKRGDRVHRVIKLTPPTNGYWADLDIYAKRADGLGQWGHFPWVTDSLLENPNDSEQLIRNHTDKGQPCPYGTASIIGHRKYRCTYTTASSIKSLHDATGGSGDPRRAMWSQIAGKYCGESATRLDEAVGGGTCRNHVNATNLAKAYCEQGGRIKSESGICTQANLSGHYNSILKAWCDSGGNIKDALCDALSDTDKNTLSKNYCDSSAGRSDSFCECYNVVNGVCSNHSSAAGCAKKRQTFDKLVEATPSDQRNVWSGMESCFGRVCTGSNKYIQPNTNQNCNKPVNVCIQDIDIGSMTDSNINPVCDIKSGDTPSAGPPQLSAAEEELQAAEAAVARGDAGAEEELQRAREKLDRLEQEQGIDAYIPKSLEDLKTNRKKQFATFGGVGGIMMCCCFLVLLVVIASKGGRRTVRR